VEKSGEPPPFPRARAQGAGQEKLSDPSDLDLAKKRMCRLLGIDPARAWSNDAEHTLPKLLPIPEDEWLAIEWLHAQTGDAKRPKLRMTPSTLCEYWQDEVSKARQYAKSLGASLSGGELLAKKERPPAPIGWSEWLASKHPRAARNFSRFEDLPADIQAECRQDLDNSNRGEEAA
jgi:hypothetical protein